MLFALKAILLLYGGCPINVTDSRSDRTSVDFSYSRFCPAPVFLYKQWSARLMITSTHICSVVRVSGCSVEWLEKICWEGCRRIRLWPSLRYYPSTGVAAWAKLLGIHVCLQYQISSARYRGIICDPACIKSRIGSFARTSGWWTLHCAA